MSFEIGDLELLSELEGEFDLGFKNLADGLYHFQIRAESSKVDRDADTNEPKIRIFHKVIGQAEGEPSGGHSEFFRWYPRADTADDDLVAEAKKTRGRIMNYGRNLAIGLADSPEGDIDKVDALMVTLRAIPTDVPMTEELADMVESQFNVLLTLLDGLDFYASITSSMNKDDAKKVKAGTMQTDDARVYTNLNPSKNWEEAAAKVGDAIEVGSL